MEERRALEKLQIIIFSLFKARKMYNEIYNIEKYNSHKR